MVSDELIVAIQEDTGAAVIMAGSDSDEPHIKKLTDSLDLYGIPHEVRICSAHKQPDTLMSVIEEYNSLPGSVAFIAVAGGTDALSGTLSYHAMGPVISSPPDPKDRLPNTSCLTNPPGSSSAYIQRPENVGRFVAQMYAGRNDGIKEKLEGEISSKVGKLTDADERFRDGKFRGD